MAKNTLENLRKEIGKLKNPAKAKLLAGFFKTGKGEYGEGDQFLGIVVPKQRALVKKYWKEIEISEALKLLQSSIHEERLIALLLLVKKFESGSEKDPSTSSGQEIIFDAYLKNTKYINNWDLVDLTAPKIVGAYLEKKDRKILYKLAKSKDLWEKRIAVLATFWFIKDKDSKDALAIAEILLNDKHDLIHKAVGWMLREVGKRCSQEEEEKFLQKYYKIMPRTMLRYSIEKFPEKKRQEYLKK